MSTTYTFQEIMDQRSAKGSQSDVTLRRVYQLITTDSGTGRPVRIDEAAAYAYIIAPVSPGPGAGFPIGSSHPSSSAAKLTSIDLQDAAADGCQWEATLEWRTGLSGSAVPNPDPLSRTPEVVWSQSPQSVEIFKDFSTTPQLIQPSSGEQFETLPTRDQGFLSVEYTRNESTSFFRGTVLPLMAYDLVVNSASFTIDGVTIPALYARLSIRNAQKTTEGSTTFYRVTYHIEFRQGNDPANYADGWRERYLDRGYYTLGASPAELIPIYDKDGQIVTSPWPLNGSGFQMPNSTDAPAVLGPYKLNPEVSFSALGFT